MAEETKTNVAETTENNATVNATVTEPVVDTVSKAEYEKLKSALDKALKEKGDITKQLRAKQSEDERISAEQAEAQRIRDEEFEAMKAELNHNKAVNAYKSIPDEKMVESLIDAVSDADHIAIANIMEKYASVKVKEAQTEWLKSRPQANAGQYSSMTAEQIMAIKDSDERLRAIAMNPQAFK
jgi:hypothetical protein